MKSKIAFIIVSVMPALLVTTWLIGSAAAQLPSSQSLNLATALTSGGSIAGRVTDARSDAGVASVLVSAARQDMLTAPVSATTDIDGNYTITGLDTGVYQVSFDPPLPYFAETFDNWKPGNGFTPITVTAPLTTTNINAALQRGLLITGTVTGPNPLDEVYVSAYRGADDCYAPYIHTETQSNGTYELGPLDPGDYRVYFSSTDLHASLWYSNSPTYAGATVIPFTDTVTNINAELPTGSRITGTVTGPGGALLAGVWVYVSPAGSSQVIASGSTDASGQYSTSTGLAPAAYQVYLAAPPGYVSQWYNAKPTQATANVISVSAGVTTTNINAQLAAIPAGSTGALTGTVTAEDTHQPLDMIVYAYDATSADIVHSARTVAGTYTLNGLPPGSYRLYMAASPPYVPRYYNGQADLASANLVTVTAGITVTNINQVIPRGGVITGTVMHSGASVPGVLVSTRRVPGDYPARSAYTGVDGAFRLDGLDWGNYTVQFNPPYPFVSEWYSGAANESQALTVSVSLSATTLNVNAALETGGIITGAVTAADTGIPLAGAFANVHSAISGALIVSAYVNIDGNYQTPSLLAGDYKISFGAGPWMDYLPQWYDHAPSITAALTVTVPGPASVVPNVNARLDRGGSISGWIYEVPTGLLLEDTYIAVYNAATNALVASTHSNAWGFYLVSGLPTGQYKVYFSKGNYPAQWYENTPDPASAGTVEVSAPYTTPNINAYLRPYRVYLPLVVRNASIP